MTLRRQMAALLAGLLLGAVMQRWLESLSPWPAPQGLGPPLDAATRSAWDAYLKSLPTAAFGFTLAIHAGCAATAAATAVRLLGRPWRIGALIVGCVFLLMGMLNLVLLPHPAWFAVVDLLLFVPAALLGGGLVGGWLRRRNRARLGASGPPRQGEASRP